jgi:hypothetical protein
MRHRKSKKKNYKLSFVHFLFHTSVIVYTYSTYIIYIYVHISTNVYIKNVQWNQNVEINFYCSNHSTGFNLFSQIILWGMAWKFGANKKGTFLYVIVFIFMMKDWKEQYLIVLATWRWLWPVIDRN